MKHENKEEIAPTSKTELYAIDFGAPRKERER